MNWSYTEEQQEIRNLSRKILEDLSIHDRLVEIEASDDGIDRKLYAELGRANLLGVALDEEFGGGGMGFLALGVLLQEIGRTVAQVPVVASVALAGLPIARFGSAAQKRRWLPGVASGQTILTAGLAEAGNDDPGRPQTSARRTDGGWSLDGEKICVPSAHAAERILVPARISEEQVGVFLVDPQADGVTLERQRTTNNEPHFLVTMSGAAVPDADVLGDADPGMLKWIVDRATIAYCLVQLGVSERALEMTAEYTSQREQFDRPVGSFQAVHMRAGDAYVDVEAMRLTALRAAWLMDVEQPDDGLVAVAKFWAADGGQRVGYAAQHLHGGIGIDVDYPLHRYYLWAKQIELTLGSAPVELARIGAMLANEPAPA